MLRFTAPPMTLLALAAFLGMAAGGPAARADGPAGGSVEVANHSGAPVLVVVDNGSRGEGANVKAHPGIADRLGLTVGAGKAHAIANCFNVGEGVTLRVYAVKDGEPAKELYRERFSTGTPLDLSYPVVHGFTKDLHVAWDGGKLTDKRGLRYARGHERTGGRGRQDF